MEKAVRHAALDPEIPPKAAYGIYRPPPSAFVF
jgi:hypothetical protein